MSIVIENDGTTVAESEFDNSPLEEGKYLVSILSTEKDKPGVIVKRPYAKQGPNTKVLALAIRVRVHDGQKGAGRNLFKDIPLTRKFAPTGQGKYPDGTPAFDFFSFFRALGYDVDAPEGFAVPEDRELLGKFLEVVVATEVRDGYAPRSIIKYINKPSESSLHVSAAPKASAAPAQQWTPGAPAQAAPAAAPAAPAWTPGQVSAAPAQQPVAGTPPWLATPDAALAAAASNTQGF